MASYKDKLPKYGADRTGASGPGLDEQVTNWASGFAMSALSSVPELFGIKPLAQAEEFRQENPIAGFASQLVGFGVPYAGWFKASKAIKPFEKVINSIGNLEKHPFATGAAREAVRYLPFEAGRVAASQVVGDEDFGTMFGDAALSLAAAGGIGGVLTGIAASGARKTAAHALIPGVDIALPIQLQMRQIGKMMADPATDPSLMPKLGFRLNTLRKEARAESLGEDVPYIAPLEGFKSDTTKQVNRLFKNKPGEVLRRRRLTESSGDFKKTEEWRAEASAAGLPDGFEPMGQFFRHISVAESGKGAKGKASEVDGLITRNFSDVGDGWWMAREADDGLYVMAKKTGGKPGEGSVKDKWLLFKTDEPGQFAKSADKWTKGQVKVQSWNRLGEIASDGGDVYNTLSGFLKHFPLHNYIALQAPGAISKLLPQRVKGPMNETVARLGDAVKEYLAPAVHQFKKSPRANWVWNAARATYDSADTLAQKILYGVQKANPGKSVFAQVMRNKYDTEAAGSIKQIIDPLSDEDVRGLWLVWRKGIAPENVDGLVTSGQITPAAAAAAKALEAANKPIWDSLNKALKAAGERAVPGMKGHYGLSRLWEGDVRIAIRDEAGNVVAVASGYNRSNAQKIAKELADENPTWEIAEEFNVSDMRAIPKDLVPVVGTPSFVKERKNIRGFRWDKEAWTKDELMEAYTKAVQARTKYQATLSVKHILQPHVDQLAKEDTVAHRLLAARLDDMAGVQSPFSMIQNQIVDTVLAPILGNNSASKLIAGTNNVMWHLQLGGLKLSYPIVNALTFVQTVMPEVAFVTHAQPSSLAGRYSYFAAGGTKGPVGALGVLNPLRLMRDSMREMRKPEIGLTKALERAQNERVIDPRLVEEYIGESAVKLTDMRSAMKSGGGFVDWLRAVSEFLPANSERLSRGHAFVTGHILGRDHLKLEGEQLYRFAKQFTENTMYMYQASDRPRVFTTPLGSGMGLFKNWMMNYMATMLEYTGEGLSRSNWAPLLWQLTGTAAVGGVAATPLALAANMFSEHFTDKSLIQHLYDDDVPGWFSDGVTFGIPAALTGVSLYSQTSSPAANPVRDANMMFGVATLERMKSMVALTGEAWDHWQATGEHPGRSPAVRDQLIRSFAPVTIYRTIGAIEDEKIRSLTSGYPMMTGVGLMDRVLFSAGFNPTGYEKEMYVANELFADRAARMKRVAQLGEAWAEAQLARDGRQMQSILNQAIVWGIDTSSVLKSATARLAKRREETIMRNFRPQDIGAYQNVLSP